MGMPELSSNLDRLHSVFESEHEGYLLSTNRALMDIGAIHAFLTRSYWSPGIPYETVSRAVANSLCFGLFAGSSTQQIGFARFVTDAATFAYLCDVYVLEEYRGRGLGHWLVTQALAHPALKGLRRIVLVTRDVHALYRRYGFCALANPDSYMEIYQPDVYR
jgi:ribosomal protein S18 acetylase RimI-like enzyme